MKERLVQLLDLEQISPSKFADIIGVQRSSISHVISGRNKPSFDFLQKTLKAFPGLNAEWLIMGEGTMYEQMGRGVAGTLFDTPQEPSEVPSGDHIPDIAPPADHIEQGEVPFRDSSKEPFSEAFKKPSEESVKDDESAEKQDSITERKVVQVMVLYDDDTFRSFRPSL